MILPVLGVLAIMLAVMSAGWLTVRATDNGGWTDVFWTFGTGASLAMAALTPQAEGGHASSWRHIMVAALAATWSVRLGYYIAIRVARGAEDVRYTALKAEWRGSFMMRMFALLIAQAPITALLSISVLYAARAPSSSLRIQDVLGALVLVVAILGESVADGQMKRFKAAHHGEKNKVCDTGLWAWSRHPNYLFEALGWFAYPVIAIDFGHPSTLWSLIAPAVMFAILRFGTGVPPLEAAMVKSKGDAYRRYQARVSPFLPRPPKSERTA